ncbi:MAG: restriction endonuclease [Ruminococcaceae bacterium]|nr:restriction endonuclease [Oscillospiraceae bacterium]
MTYKDKVIHALEQLNGHAYLSDIYQIFEEISYSETLPKSYKAIIRATLERNSSDSVIFDGNENLFYSVDGIGNGHWGLRNFNASDNIELSQEDDEFCEGKQLLKKHLLRERNPVLISKAKKNFINSHGHLYCEICGFDFEEKYGALGENFIEAHHIKPISTMSDGEKTKISDIVMVCSNCHSMIHRKKPWLTKETLKALLKEE